jgi:hypothetical protein
MFKEHLDAVIVIILGISLFVFGIWYNLEHPHLAVRYDCSIAEIHPDYPTPVKEACRKLRAEYILQSPK